MNSSGSNKIYCCKDYGPTFGGYGYNSTFYDTYIYNVESNSDDENDSVPDNKSNKHDFMIVDKSNINTKSFTQILVTLLVIQI